MVSSIKKKIYAEFINVYIKLSPMKKIIDRMKNCLKCTYFMYTCINLTYK